MVFLFLRIKQIVILGDFNKKNRSIERFFLFQNKLIIINQKYRHYPRPPFPLFAFGEPQH